MVKPDIETLNLLDKIQTQGQILQNISELLIACFPEYIHNRVGTLLSIAEKAIISPSVLPKLIPGKIVAYQSRYDEYMWAIYIRDFDDKRKEIYVKDNNRRLVKKLIFNHSLVEHPESHNIMQISERTFRLNKDSLIDSYNINK
jgi:hypothetical protein